MPKKHAKIKKAQLIAALDTMHHNLAALCALYDQDLKKLKINPSPKLHGLKTVAPWEAGRPEKTRYVQRNVEEAAGIGLGINGALPSGYTIEEIKHGITRLQNISSELGFAETDSEAGIAYLAGIMDHAMFIAESIALALRQDPASKLQLAAAAWNSYKTTICLWAKHDGYYIAMPDSKHPEWRAINKETNESPEQKWSGETQHLTPGLFPRILAFIDKIIIKLDDFLFRKGKQETKEQRAETTTSAENLERAHNQTEEIDASEILPNANIESKPKANADVKQSLH